MNACVVSHLELAWETESPLRAVGIPFRSVPGGGDTPLKLEPGEEDVLAKAACSILMKTLCGARLARC